MFPSHLCIVYSIWFVGSSTQEFSDQDFCILRLYHPLACHPWHPSGGRGRNPTKCVTISQKPLHMWYTYFCSQSIGRNLSGAALRCKGAWEKWSLALQLFPSDSMTLERRAWVLLALPLSPTTFRKSIYSGLCQVLDAACRIFDLNWALMFFSWDLESQQVNSYLQLVGSSSRTKDQIRAPYIGSAES